MYGRRQRGIYEIYKNGITGNTRAVAVKDMLKFSLQQLLCWERGRMFPGWGDKSVCVVGEKTNVFDIMTFSIDFFMVLWV